MILHGLQNKIMMILNTNYK